MSIASRRRRIFWKPKSVYEHPEWPKKIAQVKQALPAFDQLPQPIREAMSQAHHDFAAVEMLALWKKALTAMPEWRALEYIVNAIKQSDQLMDNQDRSGDATMSTRRNPAAHRQ
jgi:hypothetical protein